MLCDICKKREASVHLTEIINEEVTELHLCETCAKSKGAQMQQHFSIADFLSGLVDFPAEEAKKQERIKVKCPACGMSYSDFKRLGRLGCSSCYESFKRAIYPLLKRIHGSTRHVGKQPGKISVGKKKTAKPVSEAERLKGELEGLRRRMAKAVEMEEFEEAAILRDRIRSLEAKDKKRSKGDKPA